MTPGKLSELESVRGLAAAVVVGFHILVLFDPDEAFRSVPGCGAWRNGPFAVRVFFVLSGLVLTRKFFQTGRPDLLPAAAVRRYPRLLLPVAASVAAGYGLAAAGGLTWFHRATELRGPPATCPDEYRTILTRPPTAALAAKEAVFRAFVGFDPARSVNPVLWTMEVELAGSLFAFAVAAAVGRRRRRGVLYLVAAGACVKLDWPYFLDFLAGVGLADRVAAARPARRWWAAGLLPAGLAVGDIHVVPGGLVNYAGVTDPAALLAQHLVCTAGAAAVVAGAVWSPAWAGVLRVRPLVWLGRVSFCLYLVHLLVLFSVGSWVYVRAVEAGYSTRAGGWAGGLATAGVALPLAYLGAVTLDDWSVALARWVDGRLFPVAPAGGPDRTPS